MDLMEALLWLCLNIYHEARGEERIGQLAVAHVTLNRAELRGLTIRETVVQPAQFSWVKTMPIMPTDFKAMVQVSTVATTAISQPDFTDGATHYHKFDTHPYWADDMQFLARFGNHLFYKKYEVKFITASNYKITF